MKIAPLFLALLIGGFVLLGSGCVMPADNYEQPAPRRSATFLTLVDDSGQLTPEQLDERRRNIISYLVSEGYIYSGEDLVQSPSSADQIIRAKLALDGSFELTIYRPEHIARREIEFDPAGDPVYEYFPGDIGYMGDGIAPYFIPIAPYIASRHGGDHRRDQRGYENNPPNHQPPPGQNPNWNRDHQPPHDGVGDGANNHQPPPGNQTGNPRDPRNNHDHPANPPPPGASPVPGQNQPVDPRHRPPQPPVTPAPQNQPASAHQGPDRQPRVNTAPPTTHPAPPSPPAQNRSQPDSHRSAPAESTQSRSRPDNPPPRQSPPPRSEPAPARTAPEPARSAPAPAQTDTSKKSDSTTQDSSTDQRRR